MMKRLWMMGLVLWSGCVLAVPQALTASHKASIASHLDAMIKKEAPDANIGVDVRSITYGETVYQHDPNHLFVPASNMKLLTAQAALLELGPQFTFKTKLLVDNKTISKGVLPGNAALVFDGDPQLTSSDLSAMFAKLKLMGIKTISGNFVVDTTAFAQDGIAPGWMWDELKYCYAAPIDGSIIDRNCLPFALSPNTRVGGPVKVYLSNVHSGLKVDNQAVTKSSGNRCYPQVRIGDSDTIHVSGCMTPGQKRQWYSASITDDQAFDKEVVLQLLHSNGIHLSGQVVFAQAGSHYKTAAIHYSESLQALVKQMLKVSDNIIAGALFKKVGQHYYHQSATWGMGSRAVAAILHKRMGLSFAKINMVDGSGLSRYDLISPDQLVNSLIYSYKDFPYSADFMNSLPISGRDGTLKWRMGSKVMINKVKAKTGTMSGVSSLSGYLQTKHNETLAFSIMMNGYVGSSVPYRRLQDQIVTYLSNLRR